jgi:hypothetical protein
MLINVLSCVAITCIIVHSEIFRWLRELALKLHSTIGYWISCPMCFGFWVGVGYGYLVESNMITLGLLSSLCSWATYNLVTAFDAVGNYYTAVIQNGDADNE